MSYVCPVVESDRPKRAQLRLSEYGLDLRRCGHNYTDARLVPAWRE